jgi:glutathione S-transferase/RNA polymerase-associated protein
MLKLYDHPLSPYAQKVKIALLEKDVPFDTLLPDNIGAGGAGGEFIRANPRGEVPALIDGDCMLFDSTIILEYIEDKWPDPALLPDSPNQRARARTIEEVMDTHFEAITWGLSEITYFKRAKGDEADRLVNNAGLEIRSWFQWLEAQLSDRDWFVGERFGWADLCVVPYLNGALGFGFAPDPQSRLSGWLERANGRPTVARTAQSAAEFLNAAAGAGNSGMDAVADLLDQGLFKREYRDHRLEWMIRNGGFNIVDDGLRKSNIRFTDPFRA